MYTRGNFIFSIKLILIYKNINKILPHIPRLSTKFYYISKAVKASSTIARGATNLNIKTNLPSGSV